VDAQAEGVRRLRGFEGVQVVRPSLGEVFPGMGASVAVDMMLLLGGLRTFLELCARTGEEVEGESLFGVLELAH